MKVIQALINVAKLQDQHKPMLGQVENASQYGAETVARACAIWREANKADLKYSGPGVKDIEREIAAADDQLRSAQAEYRKTELALLKEYGDGTGAADPTVEIDMGMIKARDTAGAAVTKAKQRQVALIAELTAARRHETAKAGAVAILAELIGFEG